MKIGFNAYLLSSPSIRGWNRYTLNLVRELAQLGVEIVLYSTRPIHPIHRDMLNGTVRERVAPPMRYTAWEQVWLPRECKRDSIDVLHSPFNYGLPLFCGCARILTLHDAIDQGVNLEAMTNKPMRGGRWISDLRHFVSRQVADRIITVSNFSRRDIMAKLDVPPDRIEAIYPAAEKRFGKPVSREARSVVRSAYGLDRPYIFYIGGWEARKNVAVLVNAFAEARLADCDLVLAGGGPDQQQQIHTLVDSLGVTDRVKLLGYIDDAHLPALYAGALCFVYASLNEGFGLQLCEAMAAGCPVLASNRTSLPEVIGQGGVLFDPRSSHELAILLRRASGDPTYRATLVDAAQTRSRDFSWEDAAKQTLHVYERVASAG